MTGILRGFWRHWFADFGAVDWFVNFNAVDWFMDCGAVGLRIVETRCIASLRPFENFESSKTTGLHRSQMRKAAKQPDCTVPKCGSTPKGQKRAALLCPSCFLR